MNDAKYDVSDGRFVNRRSGNPIPEDEPVFILRARDNHAIAAMSYYVECCQDDLHRCDVESVINTFRAWRDANPDKTKEPGI